MRSRDTRIPLRQTILLLLLVSLPGFAQEARKPQLRQNRPDIPEVDRSGVICFACSTVNKGAFGRPVWGVRGSASAPERTASHAKADPAKGNA